MPRPILDNQYDEYVVLVDLGSLIPRARSATEVAEALTLAVELADEVALADRDHSRVASLELRIYGGFFAHDGTSTDQYRLAMRVAPNVRGLRHGLRIVPRLVTGLACAPHARIIGTYRGGRQRMVDQMLAQDAHLLASRYEAMVLISDDEDFFPAVLSIAMENRTPIHWIRQRAIGRNDGHLERTSVRTLSTEKWGAIHV